MKIPLFLKIFFGYVIIVLALGGSLLAVSYSTIRRNYIATRIEDVKITAMALRPEVIPLLREHRFEELDAAVKSLGKETFVRVTVIQPDGVVVADSEIDPRSMENHGTRPEVSEALRRMPGESIRYSSTIHEEMLYVAIPLSDKSTIIGILRLSLFLKDINRLLTHLRNYILQVGGVFLILSLVVGLIFSRRVSRSIKDLDNAAHRIAAGDFDARIFLKTNDDLKSLADSFNYMTAKIRELFSEVSVRRDELQNILGSLQEGLVVIDEKDRIRISNESFNRAFPAIPPSGHLYWEIVQDHRFSGMVQNVRKDRGTHNQDIEKNGRTLSCSAGYLPSQSAVIVTLHDITEMRKMDRVKRDLVMNASHELRTPLTAIKGYVETMIDDPSQRNAEFLSIIEKHTDRLIKIVEDLLSLSRLEALGETLDIREVVLGNLISDTLKIFGTQMKNKGLTVDIVSEDDIPAIAADPFMLEQMLINLIDNAVKYTDRGGLTICLARRGSRLQLEIRDTGIGIPAEDLSRIFERFYVVDKSRSRKLGGTGLGLSIVKHIVLLHNGTIAVESTPGTGTTFIVSLPVRRASRISGVTPPSPAL